MASLAGWNAQSSAPLRRIEEVLFPIKSLENYAKTVL
jgi:hypothetical protein